MAVLRALKLGDLLVAVPALRALRSSLPDAQIILVGLPWAREFARRFDHLLDGFREFPGWPGLPECRPQLERIPAFLAAMQAEGFDLAIQMHGCGPFVNTICELFGARYTAGFYLPGDHCPDPARFLPWPQDGLEIRRLLALVEFLGCTPGGEHLEWPLRQADEIGASRLVAGEEGEYICVHPGASTAERQWPIECFATVARALSGHGFSVVLTGTMAETELTRRLEASINGPVIDLAGRMGLGVAAAVIARARLLICNDTGVSHLAAAVRTPSVVISTGANPARWAPLDSTRHRVLCQPNGRVAPADVIDHALDLLDSLAVTPPPRPHPEGIPCVQSAY